MMRVIKAIIATIGFVFAGSAFADVAENMKNA
jgi:hypothetical protein